MKKINIAIIGASGYTGAELIRLLLPHPHAEIKILTGDTQAGKSIGDVYPHLRFTSLPKLVVRWTKSITPASTRYFAACRTARRKPSSPGLPKHSKIIDLSSDFRLADPAGLC